MSAAFQNLVLFLAATIISLLAAELFLRYVYTPPAVKSRMNITQGWGTDTSLVSVDLAGNFQYFLPRQDARVQHAEYDTMVQIDELGWRRTSPKTVESYQVVFAGDSFTFGIGVDDSQTFAWHFGANLGLDVGNVSVPGLDPLTTLQIIRANHGRIGEPDLYFIIFFIGNDFEPVVDWYQHYRAKTSEAEAPPRSWVDRLIKAQSIQFLNQLVFHTIGSHSYLLQQIKVTINRYLRLNQSVSDGRILDEGGTSLYLKRRPKGLDEEIGAAWASYVNLVQGLSDEIQSTFTVILIPDKAEIEASRIANLSDVFDIEESHFDFAFPHQVMSKAFAAADIELLDTTNCLKSRRNFANGPYYYMFDSHFTPQGAAAFFTCALRFVSAEVAKNLGR